MSSNATGRLSGIVTEIDPQSIENPVLRFLRDYWEAKRGGRAMPSRADIRPSEMKEHLGWVILVDVLPDSADFRYRMVGSRVSQYFLADSTGKTVSEAFADYGPEAIGGVQAVHRKCARDRVVLRSHGGAGWLGRSFLDFDTIYLPLSEDGETVNMILSAFTFDQAELIKSRGAGTSA
ncbi:MAG: PAS domain-containing protein [Rhizomicrobium sp.]